MKSCLVGIIVPDEEILMKWAKENGLSGTFAELCQSKVREACINYKKCGDVYCMRHL